MSVKNWSKRTSFGNLKVSKIFFNHGEECRFEIGQKELDLGHLRAKHSTFSSTMVMNISLELVKKYLILGIQKSQNSKFFSTMVKIWMRFDNKSFIPVRFRPLESKIFFDHGEWLNKWLLKNLHTFQCSLFERHLQTWWSIKNHGGVVQCS